MLWIRRTFGDGPNLGLRSICWNCIVLHVPWRSELWPRSHNQTIRPYWHNNAVFVSWSQACWRKPFPCLRRRYGCPIMPDLLSHISYASLFVSDRCYVSVVVRQNIFIRGIFPFMIFNGLRPTSNHCSLVKQFHEGVIYDCSPARLSSASDVSFHVLDPSRAIAQLQLEIRPMLILICSTVSFATR